MKLSMSALILIICTTGLAHAQQSADAMIEQQMPSLIATYKSLHAAPELSHYEEKTAAFFAKELRSLGYEVTEKVGKYTKPEWTSYGVVAVMKNGAGPTVMIRTDLDALPVEEKTGLPYASTVHMKNDQGQDVAVMHACGHDLHVTAMLGTARFLSQAKSQWHGTLVIIGNHLKRSPVVRVRCWPTDSIQDFPSPILRSHCMMRLIRRPEK